MSQRDYKSSGQSKPKTKAPIPGWLWMVIGLIIGLFIAFLVYLQQQGGLKLPRTTGKTSTTTDTRSVKQAKTESAPKPKDGIQFDFYNLLPEMEVVVPEEELQQQEKTAETQASYLLQVGSFSNRKDAEALKAHLLLLNLSPSIQSVSIDGNRTYHRVRLGPFSSTRDLSRISNRLHENDIEFITLKATDK